MKKIFKYILVFIIIIITFCITLTLASIIPKKCIEKKVTETSQILNKETNRLIIPIWSKMAYMMFDNYSDSLMINTAYSISTKTPFYSAMVARKNYIEDKTQIVYPDEAGELRSASKYQSLDQVGELNDTVNNDIIESFEYARYWHGYLVILRPLLMILNISQIRGVFIIILVVLSAVLLYKIYKKFDVSTTIIFLFGLIMCDYFYIGNSIQGTFVFMITIIASIILLTKPIYNKPLFFMIIGSLACFFDLLTVPVITLGIPLLINALINNKEQWNLRESILEIIKCCILWGIGFFGIWFIKWCLVDILYNKGLIHTSMTQFFYRTENSQNIRLNFLDILYRNFYIIKMPFLIAIFIVIILTIIKIIRLKDINRIHFNIKETIIYFIIGCIPIFWYFIFKQHSYQHAFFTYRNLWIVSTSIFLIIYNSIRIDKKEELKEGKEK